MTQVLVFCTNVLTHYVDFDYFVFTIVGIVSQLVSLNVNRIVLTAHPRSSNSNRIEWCLVEGFLSNNPYL